MARDIDKIIKRLKIEIPGVHVEQLRTTHPADDNGLWYMSLPNRAGYVQLEAWAGNCPFLVESGYNDERHHGQTIDETVSIVGGLLRKYPR